jgi:hypothetical protein
MDLGSLSQDPMIPGSFSLDYMAPRNQVTILNQANIILGLPVARTEILASIKKASVANPV